VSAIGASQRQPDAPEYSLTAYWVRQTDRSDGEGVHADASQRDLAVTQGGRGKCEAAGSIVRLTDQTLSCTARAHVATAARHAACLHVRRAMQAA